MESCHSVVPVNYGTSVSPPVVTVTGVTTMSHCHPPVYTTLAHLITIIEQLRLRNNKDCSIEIEGGDLAKNALKKLLMRCETHADEMAITPSKTNNLVSFQSPMIEDLEFELKKLQQQNNSSSQEMADQLKKIKVLEQKLKSYQEKNKKFLEKNIDMTTQNRSLKDQISILSEDYKKMKDQYDHAKKKTKQLTENLNKEKLDHAQTEMKLRSFMACKKELTEVNKTVAALKQSCLEKDRRIELIQHRKRKKRWMRQNLEKSQPGVKETFFGYDEDETSFDSETSISSISIGTLSDEDLCDELSREEIEGNFQSLMKEHMELQRLHALLQKQNPNHQDSERENKHRTQLESDLYNAQYKIEEFQLLVQQKDEEISRYRTEKKDFHNKFERQELQYKNLEQEKKQLKIELSEAQETIENLEFRIVEQESLNTTDGPDDAYHTLETIPEDPSEMTDAREGVSSPSFYARDGALTPNSYSRDGALTPSSLREGAESPEVMGYRLQEAELTASELQQKISSLQQEKARLQEQLARCQNDMPSLEEKEAQEVLKLKNSSKIQSNMAVGTHIENPELTPLSSNLTNYSPGGFGKFSHSSDSTDSNTHSCNIAYSVSMETGLLTENCTNDDINSNHLVSDSSMNNIPSDSNVAGESTMLDCNKSCDDKPTCVSCVDRKKNLDASSQKGDKKRHKCCQTKRIKLKSVAMQTSKQRVDQCLPERENSTSELSEFSSHVASLQHDIYKLRDENIVLRSHLQDSSLVDEEDFNGGISETLETKMADMIIFCESLQEKIYCSETKEKQLKDKSRLMERTVTELETSEGVLRDQVEECKKMEAELKKQVSSAQHKIAELKDIVLDKDLYETGLAEKVQFLEKAEAISSSKIAELEMKNVMLQQRLDLKEELETDAHLVITLKERLTEMQTEYDELNAKLSEMEENEEILKENWKKVAENDANTIQASKEKIKVLENSNRELKTRLREQQDRSPMLSGTSLAAELTESEQKADNEDAVEHLRKRIKRLEDEMYTLEEAKNSKIESLQERIGYLKDNEIKLSETIIEMENEERDLRSRLRLYESKGDAVNPKTLYENKIKALKSSQHDLLDRLDSYEEHEDNLKMRMQEMEDAHEKKLEQYEREIALMQEQEEDMIHKIQVFEKHEEEIMEKCERLEKENSELEAENENLNNQLDSYCDRELVLVQRVDQLEHEKDVSEKDLKKQFEKQIFELEEENTSLTDKVEELSAELDNIKTELHQLRVENDDLNERVIELDSSEQECLEKIRNIEQKNTNIDHLLKKVEVLEDAEIKLMDRVTELEEIEMTLRGQIKVKVQMENQSTETDEGHSVDVGNCTEMHDQETAECSSVSSLPSCSLCNQSTNTGDFTESSGQGKVTGLFERLQELEADNQSLSEKLSMFTVTDGQVKQLSEKIKLLENSEDKLMERVMELEDNEDKMKRELAKAKSTNISASSGFDSDFDAIEKADDSLREKINAMQNEKEDLRRDFTSSKEKVLYLTEKLSCLEQDFNAKNEKCKEYENIVSVQKEKLLSLESCQAEEKSKLMASEKLLEEANSSCEKLEINLKEEKERCVRFEKLLNEERNKCEQCEKSLKESSDKCFSLESKLLKITDTPVECSNCLSEKEIVIALKKSERGLEELIEKEKAKCSALEKTVKSEQEKCINLEKDIELRKKTCSELEKQIEDEKIKFADLEKELSVTQEKLEEVQTEYETKLSHTEGMVSHVEGEKEKLQQEVNKFVQEKQVLLEKIDELQQTQSNLSSQLQSMQSSNQNSVPLSNDIISAATSVQMTNQNVPCSSNQHSSLSDSAMSSLVLNSAPLKTEQLVLSKSEMSDQNLVQNLNISESSSKFQELEIKLKEKQEQEKSYLQTIQTLETAVKNTRDSDVEIKYLNDQIKAFHDIVKGVVHDIDNALQQESPEVYSANKSQTFLYATSFPPCIEGTLRSTLVDLRRCKNCLLEKLAHLHTTKSSKRASDDSRNREVLLERILQLETNEKQLKDHIKLLDSGDQSLSSSMLEKPEDILRQRIGELEKLEKHLKQQVLDLEHDRDELHEIARKDKKTIHEQNVRLRELQLSEKNLKTQVNQFEVSERGLYNKIDELEDKINNMEDRISELQILEMRLKELVRKYKLDEEVWLSKSQNLESSMTDLSVTEAKLRKDLSDMVKERDGLLERVEYLQLRLNELENAEAGLIQRLKDQENKEISLNSKLAEIHTTGSAAEQQAGELQVVNMDLSQRLDQALQENAAITHHATQLQNQLHVLDQQMISLSDTEVHLKQEVSNLEKREKELQKQVKDYQIKNVEIQAKVREVDEGEAIMKDKISMLQRSENRLKYRIQELESCDTHIPLDVPGVQKDRLPHRLEDCQRRIIILQQQNEKLKSRLEDYQNLSTSKSVVKLPQREYQELQRKVALLEQTERQLDEIEENNAQLLDIVKQLKASPDAESNKGQIEAAEECLERSNKAFKELRQIINSAQWGAMGPNVQNNGTEDQQMVSDLMYMETTGRQAERGTYGKDQRSTKDGHPVHFDSDMSDTSTVDEDSVHKNVRGRNSTHPKRWTTTENIQGQMIDQLVGHLDSVPDEESHWKRVESLSPRATGPTINSVSNCDNWIPIGKATSLQTSAKPSNSAQNEELVLGVTFPSETERYSTHNDTDSNSPLVKRRKFRPIESMNSQAPTQQPMMVPPTMYSDTSAMVDFAVPHAHDMSVDNDVMLAEDYGRQYANPSASLDRDLPNTTVLKSQSLKERISHIGSVLKNKPVIIDEPTDDEEDNVKVLKRKAREESRKLANYEKENKYLKEEINKLEKDLENKSRYILILEKLVERLQQVLQLQGKKSDKEVIQTVEAEIVKANHELSGVGHRKLELSQDVVALNTELQKRERELTAKRNEVDSLLKELRQWQEECRTIEDMRTNALDCLHCLEIEAGDVQVLEMSLKSTKEENNRLKQQFDNMRTEKDSAISELAPLKAKVNQLCQKCREKDDLLRRLGAELRKMKGLGKPVLLLEELRHMEAKMPTEKYQLPHNQGDEPMHPCGEVDLSQSLSSNSDQDQSSWSDMETFSNKGNQEHGRPKSTDQSDRRKKSQPTRQLPLIKSHKKSVGYRINKKGDNLSPGHMPKNPYFVAIADYDPHNYSQSGRPELELSLTEGDQVSVIGPLDNHGLYEAEVNGTVGLVPAQYIQNIPVKGNMENVYLTQQERRKKQLHSTPKYLDASPEKILQNHSQLQHSNNLHRQGVPSSTPQLSPAHTNGFLNETPRKHHGYLNESLSPRLPQSIQDQSSHKKGYPEPPTNLTVERRGGDRSVLLTWTPPQLNALAQSNGSQVIGYKIYLNGKVHHQVNSPHLTKSVVDKLDFNQPLTFGIQTLTTGGQVSVVKETVYHHGDHSDEGSSDQEEATRFMNSNEYQSGRKRTFMGVYDYNPAKQSPRQFPSLELSFTAGDVITVHGNERPDGYYYGEISGRRGLVPASFMEEIPFASHTTKHLPKTSHTVEVQRGHKEVKQKNQQ